MGSIGVTGSSAANALAEKADVILAVGSRLQDFTTGSWALFKNAGSRIIGLNVQPFDAVKHRALPLVADARVGLDELSVELGAWRAPAGWTAGGERGRGEWLGAVAGATAPTNAELPSDGQVIGAVQRAFGSSGIVVCAAGGLPGELHKLWQAGGPGTYHLEYGYSCMGYEIAGGLGVKMARPDEDVVVMVGDGSYLMLNSEIATSIMLGLKLTIVVLDNRGYGCINRLQMATGGANFNNLLKDTRHVALPTSTSPPTPRASAPSPARSPRSPTLEAGLADARGNDRTTVLVIDTDPLITTQEGGHWWDVAVPEVSRRSEVADARAAYERALAAQRLVN